MRAFGKHTLANKPRRGVTETKQCARAHLLEFAAANLEVHLGFCRRQPPGDAGPECSLATWNLQLVNHGIIHAPTFIIYRNGGKGELERGFHTKGPSWHLRRGPN